MVIMAEKINVNLLKFLFFLLILLFPLGEIIRFDFGNGITLLPNDVLVSLVVISWLFWRFLNKKNLQRPLAKPIFIFIGILLLSLIVNIKTLTPFQSFVSFLYLLRFGLYAGLYFVVFDFPQEFKRKIPFFMILSGTLVVLVGYIQFFLYPSLRNLYYLGWDEHLYRMFSSFLDPNFLGTFLVLNFLLIGGIFFNYLKNKKWERVGLLGILGMLTLVAVFLTYSRGALLMLAVGVFVFLVMMGKKRWLIGFLIISVLIFLLLPRAFQSEGTNFLRIVSSQARLRSAKNALIIFKENPVLGVGFNAYRYAQHRYGFIKDEKWQVSHGEAGTDNSFLFILATGGLVGFIACLYLWIKIFQSSVKGYITIVVVASSLGLFVNALFINSLFYPFIVEWMWILIGLKENK